MQVGVVCNRPHERIHLVIDYAERPNHYRRLRKGQNLFYDKMPDWFSTLDKDTDPPPRGIANDISYGK